MSDSNVIAEDNSHKQSHKQGHKQRVLDEFKELMVKLGKLNEFRTTETFYNLPGDEQDLLLTQNSIMGAYANILMTRINLWDREKDS